ncbi:cytochrome oxidase complex assembly protein 1-domain-containing protein [Lineolata rhizophorae]|uniref:Cytochrome oxidase complex assembly protein 1-domain-containing protein n=1 Tax=Lineolata rhizophorae TaxID=578093 RepID=A0A6A6PCH7_9PEZI|nr:cytochrome oxidase complex assembly protein 1-domain-containing protein [Lineolata rhizophorae]
MRPQPFFPRPLGRATAKPRRPTQAPRARGRGLVAPPRPGSQPWQNLMMSRRSDRELPPAKGPNPWLRSLPVFLPVAGAALLALLNYQRQSSSVVGSSLYALRTHPRAREALGDNVYFAHKWPWIWGELNQLHGRIDISFKVKGTRGSGYMRFRAVRKHRMGFFETQEWSLTMDDGTVLQLLTDEAGASPLPQRGDQEGFAGPI